MTEDERLVALTEILLDPSARLDERDDAAMDLGQLGRREAVEALLTVARDPTADSWNWSKDSATTPRKYWGPSNP